MHGNRQMAGRNSLPQNTLGQKAVQHPGKERHDIDLERHGGIPG
jgi:hypothetical protein